MKFIVDANLPPALARWLASEGREAYHVNNLGMTSTPDRTIWQHAREMNACIVTKDEDFTLLQALDPTDPLLCGFASVMPFAVFYWDVCPGIWPSVVSAIERGDKVVEVK